MLLFLIAGTQKSDGACREFCKFVLKFVKVCYRV